MPVLVFSSVGYVSQEINVGSQTTLNVHLVPSTGNLNQVVVVGYGTQKRLDVTGAIAHVKGDELSKQPVLTATQALQGQVAGVQVTSSGQPGSLAAGRYSWIRLHIGWWQSLVYRGWNLDR